MAKPISTQGMPPASEAKLLGSKYRKMSSTQQLVRHIALPDIMSAEPIRTPAAPIAISTFRLIRGANALSSAAAVGGRLRRTVRPEGQKGAPNPEDGRGP